jgi:hypothetical protein
MKIYYYITITNELNWIDLLHHLTGYLSISQDQTLYLKLSAWLSLENTFEIN